MDANLVPLPHIRPWNEWIEEVGHLSSSARRQAYRCLSRVCEGGSLRLIRQIFGPVLEARELAKKT